MKLVKNKILKFSVIFTLLFSVSASNVACATNTGFFSGIYNTVKSGFGLFSKNTGTIGNIVSTNKTGTIISGAKKVVKQEPSLKALFYLFSVVAIFFTIGMAWIGAEDMELRNIDLSFSSKNNVLRYWILDWAFKHNQIKILKYLFNEKNCPDVNVEYSLGYRPVDYACKYNNVEILRWLIDVRGASTAKNEVETVGEGGDYANLQSNKKDPIKIASENNNSEAFKFLVDKEANNNEDFFKKAIKNACLDLNLKMIKYLVEIKKIQVPLWCIINILSRYSGKRFGVLKYLIENGLCTANDKTKIPGDNADPESLLYLIAKTGALKSVLYLLDNGAIIDLNIYYPETADFGLNEYLRNIDELTKKLEQAFIDLKKYLANTINPDDEYLKKEVYAINNIFDSKIPLYAKQSVLTSLIKLHDSKSNFIKLDFIKQLCKKIEFNYTFVNDPKFTLAVEFALQNNFTDINGKSILEALATYNRAEYAFENKGDLYRNHNLILKKLKLKGHVMEPFKEDAYDINRDYSETWDNLKKNKKAKQLDGFIRKSHVMYRLNKFEVTDSKNEKHTLPNEVVGKIIGYGV